MIERLKNCPQCAGILNDSGRCGFCGSKVYDFLNISFEDRYMPSARTYLRLKVKDKIVLAPVMADTISAEYHSSYIDCVGYINNTEYLRTPCYPTLDVTFRIIGDMIEVDDDADM